MPVAFYVQPSAARAFVSPANATRPLAIGYAYTPPSVPPPDPPADIVTVPAEPFSDSLLGGATVTFGAVGNGFYYPSMDRSLRSGFPAGFTSIALSNGTFIPRSSGLELATSATAGSRSFIETNIDYDYGDVYAHFDVSVDAKLAFPPSDTGLASPVDAAVLQNELADGSAALIRIVRGSDVRVTTDQVLVEGRTVSATGAVTSSGAVALDTIGRPTAIRLRLVRNAEYVFGLVGIVDGATNEVVEYKLVFNFSSFASSTGTLAFGVDNRSSSTRVRTSFSDFVFRPCMMVVPRSGLGGSARLFDGVFLPTRWRLVGAVPAALYSLRDLGPHDVDVFGVWGRSRMVGALEYVLPPSRVVGKTSSQQLVTPTDQEVA